MIRSSQPLFEEGEDFTPTPLEDILRPVSAFMSEPLDVPDDRFVSLEDMLYAAGSAFARPSAELEEYYVTARKREAEAETEEGVEPPAMPDSVTKPEEIVPPKPEDIADTKDFGYEFPNHGKALEAQDPGSIPPIKADPITDPDKYKEEKDARADAIAANKHKLQTPVPSNLMGKMGRKFGTEEEALQAVVDNIQQLTQTDARYDKQEYGAYIRAKLDASGKIAYYYHDQVYRGRKGNSVNTPLANAGETIESSDPVVAFVHTHPRGADHQDGMSGKPTINRSGLSNTDQMNEQLSPGDRGIDDDGNIVKDAALPKIRDTLAKYGKLPPSGNVKAYLITPTGKIQRFEDPWTGEGQQVMSDYDFNYVRDRR